MRSALGTDLSIIDVDVHANLPSLEALFPYMDEVWIQLATERGWGLPSNIAVTYPPAAPSSVDNQWRPADGRLPASELSLLQEHVLDRGPVANAIVNCYPAVDSVRHPDWSAALARAANDWIKAEWLAGDSRLRASIVVPARSPEEIVREIDRLGNDPGFVQVLMPVRSDRLYGHRNWHPVYEAMVRHGLTMGLHWGGTTETGPSSSGWPSWYAEEYAAEQQVYASQITSLVGEGTFQVFPQLHVSVLEGGFAWLPSWWWRMDADWKGLRRDVPWLDRPPSQVIREHFRFATAPIDAGPPDQLAMIVKWLESEDLLMYSSDYPHTHADDLDELLSVMPSSMRPKVMAQAAREWYRL
jgi:hypothetical protein